MGEVLQKNILKSGVNPLAEKHKILIVDDEPGIRKLLTFEFNYQGYETTAVENADEALLALKEGSFELVITDIRMPGSMDGIDLIEAYRKEKPGQYAIFMTGYAVEEKLTLALQNPHSICFKKPFDIHVLAQSVTDYFQHGTWGK